MLYIVLVDRVTFIVFVSQNLIECYLQNSETSLSTESIFETNWFDESSIDSSWMFMRIRTHFHRHNGKDQT